MRKRANPLIAPVAVASLLLTADSSTSKAPADPGTFQQTVQPIFPKTCSACHNDRLSSGGLNLGKFSTPASLTENRDGWDRILQKIRSGEMPPKGIPRPPAAQMDALVKFVQAEFDKADSQIKPDPGRVTARRLNRNEYSNTI